MMGKYSDLIIERIKRGNLPIGYDLYNKTDVTELLPTLPASYGIIGRIGTTIIFELMDVKVKESIRFASSHGIVEAHEFDSVSLTFGMSTKSKPHSPVMMNGICKTITTMCDHDIGVVIADEDE